MDLLRNSILSDVADWLTPVPVVSTRPGIVGLNADGPPPTGLVTEGAVRRSTTPEGASSLTVRPTADRNGPVRDAVGA